MDKVVLNGVSRHGKFDSKISFNHTTSMTSYKSRDVIQLHQKRRDANLAFS